MTDFLSQREPTPRRARRGATSIGIWYLAVVGMVHSICQAADLEAVRKQVAQGQYEEAVNAIKAAGAQAEPDWPLLLGQAFMELGRYQEAVGVAGSAVKRLPNDLNLRQLEIDALQQTGATEEAARQLAELNRIARSRSWAYRAPAERVTLGSVALLFGEDPKAVLDQFFDPVRKADPEYAGSYLATGQLALKKSDFALAAKTFSAATRKFPEDAALWLGLAQAYATSDSEAALGAASKALQFNPRLVDAWLLFADHYLDSENYPAADKAIATALQTNPHRPETQAYRAVLAHLRADAKTEADARAAARKLWRTNPHVPHLIGRKLSQKYRFAEGAVLQREALKFEPTFIAAKAQLANDLLRLGQDEEGWRLAEEVQKADPYDVVAYNLTNLREVMSKFRTINSEHFTLRMDPHEADVYGKEALDLLERAHSTLTRKYGLQPREKTIVEIFPDQKDFAIRTFGLPGGDGYLGVCFGRVITANSPASRPNSPSNWEAVLWHEFAHVVTLTLTRNKMPRWLSEGISVFEERQARGSWGEQMKPRYRAMILGEDLTPVSELSAAFLRPKTPAHLGFAYYESSLVAEWLTQRWGLDKMKRLMEDLARGVEINGALATHFAPIGELDAEFAKHAQQLAKNVGPKLDWAQPPPAVLANQTKAQEWIAENPNNFTALMETAKRWVAQKSWADAKVPLLKLVELYPSQHDPDSAYPLLARVHRELGETDAELAVWSRFADLAADATPAFERLMQAAAERKDWPLVLEHVGRYQAVDPLRAAPHRLEAEALAATGKNADAIRSYRKVLALDGGNPPAIHFEVGRLLYAEKDPEAKRHVLLALEEAPRFRAAHQLLLQIVGDSRPATPPANASPAPHVGPSSTP